MVPSAHSSARLEHLLDKQGVPSSNLGARTVFDSTVRVDKMPTLPCILGIGSRLGTCAAFRARAADGIACASRPNDRVGKEHRIWKVRSVAWKNSKTKFDGSPFWFDRGDGFPYGLSIRIAHTICRQRTAAGVAPSISLGNRVVAFCRHTASCFAREKPPLEPSRGNVVQSRRTVAPGAWIGVGMWLR